MSYVQPACVNGEIYHVYTKSIAGFRIFNTDADLSRMRRLLRYYQFRSVMRFSDFLNLHTLENNMEMEAAITSYVKGFSKQVDIISYCLMPTHVHLILKQLKDNGITLFMGN